MSDPRLTDQRLREQRRRLNAESREGGFPAVAGASATVGEFVVITEQANHLVCRRLTDQTASPTQFLIAKPPELRHDAALYDRVDTLSSNAPHEVEVTFTDETGDETWMVTLPYIEEGGSKTATTIKAERSPLASDVDVNGEPLLWIDSNIAGRKWAADLGGEEES